MIDTAPNLSSGTMGIKSIAVDMKDLKKRLTLQIAALLIISFGAVVTGMAVEQQKDNYLPESHTLPSVFNRKPSGTSGLKEIAGKSGIKCKEWVLPYRQLPLIKGVLVIISPSESLADFESKQILNWVKDGNDLIYLDQFDYKFTRRLLSEIAVDATEGTALVDSTIKFDSSKPEFTHVSELTVTTDMRLTGAPALVSDASGIIVGTLKHGKGRILIGTVPSLVSNRRLSTPSEWPNFQFFVNCLRKSGGDVWFDERCHGFSNNANVFVYLMRGATGAAVLQLLLALTLGVASSAQRFGRTERLENKRKISNLEFIYGLSNAYKRAKANAASLEIIGSVFRTKLCKAMGISPYEPTERVLDAWKSSILATDTLREPVAQFLRDYDQALGNAGIAGAAQQGQSAPTRQPDAAAPPAEQKPLPTDQRRNLSDPETKALIIRCDKITEQLRNVLTQSTVVTGKATDDDKNS
jgi:hypothetical protein